MVEQMVNSKFSKNGLGEHATTFASFNKQPIVVPKTTALRDVQNDNRSSISKPSGNFASQREAECTVAPTRSTPGSIFSPPRLLSGGSTTRNQQFVYARRKSDAELINGRTSDKNHRVTTGPQANIEEPNHDGVPIPVISTANLSCDETLLPKPIRKHDQGQTTVVKSDPSLDDSLVTGNPHWRERFIQLQTYLKYCDNSNQEAYLKSKLISLTEIISNL